jgi:DNA-directed RNA polymerase subunit RPC12/RpoP
MVPDMVPAGMKTSTDHGYMVPDEPDDRDSARLVSQPGKVAAKVKTAVRCRLCRETVVLESNFRPTAATCPHCGLKFVFDPQQEPLPVHGMRLRFSEVLEAQRGPGTVRHRRHEAHVPPAVQVVKPKTNYLAWAGGLALSLAAALTLFGGWFHRLLAR